MRGGSPDLESERGVELAGSAAATWLRGHGLENRGDEGPLRLAADVVRTNDFALARLWHTARRLVRHSDRDGIDIVIVVEGAVRATPESGEYRIGRHQGLLIPADSSLEFASDSPVGLVLLSVSESFQTRFNTPKVGEVVSLSSSLASPRVLQAVTLATLNTFSSIPVSVWTRLRDTIETAASAVLLESLPADPLSGSSRHAALLARARTTIERHSRDPDFDVNELIVRLSVSSSWLHEVFATVSTTPLREIRESRLAAARAMLERRPHAGPADREEVARAAGFRGAQQLSAALRRSGGTRHRIEPRSRR